MAGSVIVAGVRYCDDIAFGIIAGGRFAQGDLRLILFVSVHDIAAKAGCLAKTQDQHTACQGVKRAGMSDFAAARQCSVAMPNPRDSIVARPAQRFVEVEKARMTAFSQAQASLRR